MFWIEDTIVDAGDRRVLLAAAGPYRLAVIEHRDGSAHWSCGVGEDDVIDEREGEAADVERAMRAAIEDARRRWLDTDGALGALEANRRPPAPAHANGGGAELAARLSSNRAHLAPKRASNRLRRPVPPRHRRAG